MSNTISAETQAARDEQAALYTDAVIERDRLQYNDVDEQNDGEGVGYWYVEIDLAPKGNEKVCRCGCLLPVASNKREFRPGHDQRLMGILVRAHRRGMEVAWTDGGALISADAENFARTVLGDAGLAKLQKYMANEPKRAARKPRAAKAEAETPIGPTKIDDIKVGRWEYPAQRLQDGTIQRNLRRDGTGEWITVEG